ncbi:hypothetical protein F1880_008664 [Penicillium rolfsii]|nr:hypothetical protein F1880_008664 [Penicillium rolfsii]
MDSAARVRLGLTVSLEPQKRTIVDYTYNEKEYFVPANIWCPPELRVWHLHVADCAYIVIQGLLFFHSLRSQHLFAMCPEKRGPVFNMHAASIRRLQQWKEQTNPVNPTLAPAAKIPAVALGFHLDQRIYDTFVRQYLGILQKFHALEYTKYCRALKKMKLAASQCLGHNDYRAWLHWYDTMFKHAMDKWHIFLKDTDMPTWEDSVDELYGMVVKCVEESEDQTAAQLAHGLCSGQTEIP